MLARSVSTGEVDITSVGVAARELVLAGSLGLGALAIKVVDMLRDLEAVLSGNFHRFSAISFGRTSLADLRTRASEGGARASGATVATV